MSIESDGLDVRAQSVDQAHESVDMGRIKQWKERAARSSPCFIIKKEVTVDASGNKVETITREAVGPEPLTQELFASTLYAAYGSANYDYACKLFSQTISGFFCNPNESTKSSAVNTINAVNGALLALNPKDEIEGMLCTRLLVLHDQYMEYISRTTNPAQTNAGVDLNINRATKLMRLYNETLEALNRYRRKGEQKVTVQHVNVGDGGQAIVSGHVNNGGGGNG